MEPTDITIEILKGIQSTLVGLREDVQATNRRLDQHETRFSKLERNTATTVEILKVISERLDEQSRVEERVDGLERRVEALEQRQSQ